MSDSDDKKDRKTGAQKSSGAKPVKRSRKRQASRPPTIDVKAVRLDTETTKQPTTKESEKKHPESDAYEKKQTKSRASENKKADVRSGKRPAAEDLKSEQPGITDKAEYFGYRTLAASAGVGAAAAVALFAVAFGTSFFSSGQMKVEDRIAVLSDKIDALSKSANNSKSSRMNSNAIKALKQEMATLARRPRDGQIAKLEDQIKSIEKKITSQKKSLKKAEEFKSLSDRLSALDVKIAQANSSVEKSIRRSTLLEQALKAAGKTIKGSADGTKGSIVAQNLRLADFNARMKTLAENLQILKNRVAKNPELSRLEETISGLHKNDGKLENRLNSINTSLAAITRVQTALKAGVEKTGQRLSKLEEVDRSGDIGRLAALSFAFENLIRKIQAGKAFERELKIVTIALPQNRRLEKLQKFSNSGVRSINRLQKDFAPVLRTILVSKSPSARSGVIDRLVGTAKSLIRIRRIGEIEGDDRDAIIARLEARVKAGDLPTALKAAKKLKGPSATAAKDWVQAVEERLKTITLIKNIRNDVISGSGSR